MNMKSIRLTYSFLPRSVYVLFFIRVITAMGNFVFPFMTLLLTSKLGMGEKEVGVYLLLASVLQIPGSLLGGKLTDIIGRKKILVLALVLSALSILPCAIFIDFPSTVGYIPWFLMLASFMNSVSNPAHNAMMNDLTVPDNRQAAFSLLYLGMNVGAAIGSFISGFLFNRYIKILFIGDTIARLISIFLLIRFIKETNPSKDALVTIMDVGNEDEKAETGGMLAALLRRPRLLFFVLIDTIYAFIYAQTHFSMPLQVNEIFGEELGAKYFGTLNMINCIEVIILTTLITVVIRKIRPIYNVSIAGIFYAIGFGMLFFVNSLPMFIISTIIWTLGEIINTTNVGVYIANHTPMSHRGRFNALINIITGTGSSLSPYLIGAFIEKNSVTYVWPLIFFLGALGSVLMFLLGSSERKIQHS